MSKIRICITSFIGIFPGSFYKNLLLNLLGHNIHKTANFGSNLVWGNTFLEIGQHSTIRPFNVFRNLNLSVGHDSIIGSWNWFSSAPILEQEINFQGGIRIGNHCGINSRNYFDCTGGIDFGDYSDLAGVRSTFITHFIDTVLSLQVCMPIKIGEYVMLSSNIKVTPGANVGSKSIVALGTVLINRNYPSGKLIAGVPGVVKATRDGLWFERKVGTVKSFQRKKVSEN